MSATARWSDVPDRLHSRGLRWTPQRRALVDVLSRTGGHVTGAELVERCRALDPTTAPSTIYRTLDVLEELGLVSHSHGIDGREEYHVLPEAVHGHLHCTGCGTAWEIDPVEAEPLVHSMADARGFDVDLSHVSIGGLDLVVRRGDQPVAGVEKTLKAEVAYGGHTIPLEVEAREEAGAYEAVFIPTAAGQYTFHLSGTIDGHAVDERFQSGPTTFDDVRDAAGGQFPVQLPSTVDLAGQARAGADAASLVPVAIALGAGGLLLGLIALGIALASRSRRVAE